MFRWYQDAQICYACLSDVPDGETGNDTAFEESLWFTRGWTLQELLAPCSVEFYVADWTHIGSKASRAKQIAIITWIDRSALESNWTDTEDTYVAAKKMPWAAHRLVTRAEDMAYCLLGLFDVNIPLLYGEGEYKAFRRLQQAVFESEADHTLFLFATNDSINRVPFVAYSTRQFCRRKHCTDCALKPECLPEDIRSSQMRFAFDLPWSALDDHYLQLVKGGVKVRLPLVRYSSFLQVRSLSHLIPKVKKGTYVALLPLTCAQYSHHVFGIVLLQLSISRYSRCLEAPIMVNVKALAGRVPVPETFTVCDAVPMNSLASD
jgi:hypothetical protein